MAREYSGEVRSEAANRRPGLVAQEDLWREILGFAAAVRSMLRHAMQAAHEGRADLAAAVFTQRTSIDQWEVRIEEECLRVLALYEPQASDLRRTVAVLKLRAELKRVGALASKIAKRSKRTHPEFGSLRMPASLQILAEMAIASFEHAVVALNNHDANAAQAVIAADKEIDHQHRSVRKQLKDAMQHNTEDVLELLRLMNTARNLERIGDHTVSIAQATVYING
jgi:phosphate transport system protein